LASNSKILEGTTVALPLRMNVRSAWLMSKHCQRQAKKREMFTNFATVGSNKAEKASRERPSDISFDMKP